MYVGIIEVPAVPGYTREEMERYMERAKEAIKKGFQDYTATPFRDMTSRVEYRTNPPSR